MTPQQRQQAKNKRRADRAAKDPNASKTPLPLPPSPEREAKQKKEEADEKLQDLLEEMPEAFSDLVEDIEAQLLGKGLEGTLGGLVFAAFNILTKGNKISFTHQTKPWIIEAHFSKCRLTLRFSLEGKLLAEGTSEAVDIRGDELEYTIERLRDLDLTPIPGNEQATLIRGLMALGRERVLHDQDNNVPMHERCSFIHPDVRPKARAICERLHEITKDKDPDFFRWMFQCDMLSFPDSDRQELSAVLHGIGNWRD